MLNPLFRSGLAFAGANVGSSGLPNEADDGLLSAAEVTTLNLVGTELVVLSACDTGLGTLHATEGVMGLRRAFQLAGARTVIASLWRVPDQQTCDLMTSFYRRLITGMPRDAALRAAQLELRQKFSSPFYWGAFVCFGDTKAIAGMERMNIYDSVANLTSAHNTTREIAALSSLIDRGSMDSRVWSDRGVCYHNLRRFAEAVEDFNRAAELAPNNALIFFNRGFSLHLLKRDEDAIKDFNRAIELQPDLAVAYHRRGTTFEALGNLKLALKDLDHAIALDPDDANTFYDRAGLLANLERFQEAMADYTNAIRLSPSFEIAYVNRATISFKIDKPDDAIQDLKTAIQLVPDDALAYLNLGSAYARIGELQKALESWERAAQLGDANVVHAARKMQALISRYLTEMTQKRGS
jgi:tetratricopeptide (TPR) repeat protein